MNLKLLKIQYPNYLVTITILRATVVITHYAGKNKFSNYTCTLKVLNKKTFVGTNYNKRCVDMTRSGL